MPVPESWPETGGRERGNEEDERRENREERRGGEVAAQCQQVKQQLSGQGSLPQSLGTHDRTGAICEQGSPPDTALVTLGLIQSLHKNV